MLTDAFRTYLLTFLAVSGTLLVTLFVGVLLQRGLDEVKFRRRERLKRVYRPFVDSVAAGPGRAQANAIKFLEGAPASHAPIIAHLMLLPLRVASGSLVQHVRLAAHQLGFIIRWHEDLTRRAWWSRADGARALGLVREPSATARLLPLLDDDHSEVRAAAVEALGLIGDPSAIPALLSRLPQQSRHQQARVIEALRAFGAPTAPALLAYGRANPDDLLLVIDVVGLIGGSAVLDDLIAWAADRRPDVRAAVLKALGSIGLDDRSYYYALKGLRDQAADVRAMAARALGRARRTDASPYLAGQLDDDWIVAAHCAMALRQLGVIGMAELSARRDDQGQAGALARQLLWEQA
jgi:HEAT repeats